jgi:hypothetical protein
MFDNTTLEHYSVLEELATVTPNWRPFARHGEHPNATQENEQLQEEYVQ